MTAIVRWEYRIVGVQQGGTLEVEKRLNEAGAAGWELVSYGEVAVMKRPVTNGREVQP